MSTPAHAHLRLVDEQGQVHEPICSHIATCEHCREREDAFDVLQRKLVGALATIGRLEADHDAEARKHELWDQAQAAHEWWRLATGHLKASFSSDDFWVVLPRLRGADGLHGVLKAICGVAYDPFRTKMRNGGTKTHDGWALINASAEKQRDYQERVPGGIEDDVTWRRWLLARVEESFRS